MKNIFVLMITILLTSITAFAQEAVIVEEIAPTKSEVEEVITEAVESVATPDAETVEPPAPLLQTPANFKNSPPIVPLVPNPAAYQKQQGNYTKCLNDEVDKYYIKKKSYRYKRGRMIANCQTAKTKYRNAVKKSFGPDADFGAANRATNKIVTEHQKTTFQAITVRVRKILAEQEAAKKAAQ